MHWNMGKSLFNTFCIIRKFHLSVLCPHVKKVQIALDEQQGNHDEIVKKENKTQLSKLPVSSCEPRVLVIFGLNKSHPVLLNAKSCLFGTWTFLLQCGQLKLGGGWPEKRRLGGGDLVKGRIFYKDMVWLSNMGTFQSLVFNYVSLLFIEQETIDWCVHIQRSEVLSTATEEKDTHTHTPGTSRFWGGMLWAISLWCPAVSFPISTKRQTWINHLGISWNGGSPKSSISSLDFPQQKPSSYGGPPMTMETSIWGCKHLAFSSSSHFLRISKATLPSVKLT